MNLMWSLMRHFELSIEQLHEVSGLNWVSFRKNNSTVIIVIKVKSSSLHQFNSTLLDNRSTLCSSCHDSQLTRSLLISNDNGTCYWIVIN